MLNKTLRLLGNGALSSTVCTLLMTLGQGCDTDKLFMPEEATLDDVRNLVHKDIISCREMVGNYQKLHDSLDPAVSGIASWNDRLAADADRLDHISPDQRGPFHCFPIIVKDNMDYAGLPTTGGAKALGGAKVGSNAEVVKRLLDAGAIVLGKSNMPDFATDGTNTLSSFAGQTVNPFAQARTVYGSSGGTAAAISVSLGIIGLGSDTYGSLVQPSSATGLVTVRPTQGLISGNGILPLMSLQDMPGPMTRKVQDAATALEILVDASLAPMGTQKYTAFLIKDGLRGMTIGFDPAALQPLPMPPLVPGQEVVDLFNQTLGNLKQAGATTKQVDAFFSLFPTLQAAVDASFKCMPVDFKQSLNSYLTTYRPELPLKSLADIIATGQYLDTVKPFLQDAQAKTETIQSSTDCQQYLSAKAAANKAITMLMDQQGLDLFVYPAANQAPYTIGPVPAGWFGFQILSSPTGLPSLEMPMGIAAQSGAPVGFIFLARSYQEAKLVQAAYSYQEQFNPRKAPPSAMH